MPKSTKGGRGTRRIRGPWHVCLNSQGEDTTLVLFNAQRKKRKKEEKKGAPGGGGVFSLGCSRTQKKKKKGEKKGIPDGRKEKKRGDEFECGQNAPPPKSYTFEKEEKGAQLFRVGGCFPARRERKLKGDGLGRGRGGRGSLARESSAPKRKKGEGQDF